MEVLVRRAGDVNPLIVRLTMNQGTNVPRSPQFCPREAYHERSSIHSPGNKVVESARFAEGKFAESTLGGYTHGLSTQRMRRSG